MSHIIIFNVGGKHYEVSRFLLAKYSNTVLATAAATSSEMGHDDDDDIIDHHTEPIYIERDSERFRYILDLMRDGKVFLPSSISIHAFIHDLDYLGFQNLPLDSIQMQSSGIGHPYFPKDLIYESGIQFHQIIWDAARSTTDVRFDKNNYFVKNHSHHTTGIVFGRTGFSSGVHFWNVKILCGPCIVGVQHDNDKSRWDVRPQPNNTWPQVATAKTDDIIGILLNMKEMYCKEYRNGQRIRTLPVGPDIYYPYVQFEGYQEIISCEVPSEKNVFHFPREETGYNSIDIPKELRCIGDIKLHQITWNPFKVAPGLVLANNNHAVKRTAAASWEWHAVQGSQGFSHGVHYWSFHMMTTAKTANIMIGICSNVDITRSYYAGMDNNGGSYCGTNGCYYCGNRMDHNPRESGPMCWSYGPTFTNSDVIGTLLDMTHKTVTFYKNGIRYGSATRVRCCSVHMAHVNSPQYPLLSGDIYYPCVALGTNGDEVFSCEVSQF